MNVKKALDLMLFCTYFSKIICDVTYIIPGRNNGVVVELQTFTNHQYIADSEFSIIYTAIASNRINAVSQFKDSGTIN